MSNSVEMDREAAQDLRAWDHAKQSPPTSIIEDGRRAQQALHQRIRQSLVENA
jgi:hypothetical protein